jgi:hypothetical protein
MLAKMHIFSAEICMELKSGADLGNEKQTFGRQPKPNGGGA